MQKKKIYYCKECRNPYAAEREKRNRLCADCGMKRMVESIRQVQEKEGPFYIAWKEGMGRWKGERKAGKRSIRPEG